jgi:hypothetical protein
MYITFIIEKVTCKIFIIGKFMCATFVYWKICETFVYWKSYVYNFYILENLCIKLFTIGKSYVENFYIFEN